MKRKRRCLCVAIGCLALCYLLFCALAGCAGDIGFLPLKDAKVAEKIGVEGDDMEKSQKAGGDARTATKDTNITVKTALVNVEEGGWSKFIVIPLIVGGIVLLFGIGYLGYRLYKKRKARAA